MMQKHNSNDTFSNIIHGNTPVLVDFYTDWCMPCRILSPILRSLAEDMGDEVRILKLDIDKHKEIMQRYKIYSVPTIFIFQHGEVIWKGSGARTKEELKRIFRSKVKVSQAL